jgi:hypothetical protein
MELNRMFAELTINEMIKKWGGVLPDWGHYKRAHENNQVRVSRTIATKVMGTGSKLIPRGYFLFGSFSLWTAIIVMPVTIVMWFFRDFSAWWLLTAMFVSWLILQVSRESQCRGVAKGAVRDQDFYEWLVNNGAFLFDPDNSPIIQKEVKVNSSMKIAISIILSSMILSASYMYTNRYQEVGNLPDSSHGIYKDMISGKLFVAYPASGIPDVEGMNCVLFPLEYQK